MKEPKKTLVLGASDNPARYSYLAIQRLRKHGHPVAGIGRRNTKVADVTIEKEKIPVTDVDTVTLYLNPTHQQMSFTSQNNMCIFSRRLNRAGTE